MRIPVKSGYPDRQKIREAHGYPDYRSGLPCDDVLKSLHHYEVSQCQMDDAGVMTIAIVAILFLKAAFRWQVNFCLKKAVYQEY